VVEPAILTKQPLSHCSFHRSWLYGGKQCTFKN